MNEQTVVKSYVRGHKQTSNEVQSADGIAKLMLIALAILLPQISVPVIALVGAAYGFTVINRQPAPIKQAEVAVEPVESPKVKRSYSRRITVNHYQLSKPIKV